MTINDMRRYVSNRYSSMKWKYKVSNMPPNQIIAIYKSFKEREMPKKEDPHYHQIDMFEYLYSINQGKETHTEVKM